MPRTIVEEREGLVVVVDSVDGVGKDTAKVPRRNFGSKSSTPSVFMQDVARERSNLAMELTGSCSVVHSLVLESILSSSGGSCEAETVQKA